MKEKREENKYIKIIKYIFIITFIAIIGIVITFRLVYISANKKINIKSKNDFYIVISDEKNLKDNALNWLSNYLQQYNCFGISKEQKINDYDIKLCEIVNSTQNIVRMKFDIYKSSNSMNYFSDWYSIYDEDIQGKDNIIRCDVFMFFELKKEDFEDRWYLSKTIQVTNESKNEYLENVNNENIEEYSYNNPIVPKGFKKKETENASWKIKDNEVIGWNNGLVIEDEEGNEFVWIPVKDIYGFERIEGYYNGQKQDYLENCKEAKDKNSGYYNIESEELYESIATYKGFYIARYEAGYYSTGFDSAWTGNQRPVSKKDAITWVNIRWGSAYNYALDGIQGSDIENGAVKVARSMYPNLKYLDKYNLPKNSKNETGVVSTLCYGIEWDLVIDFMKDVQNPYTNTKYIEDSTKMGFFAYDSHATRQPTGKDIDDKSSNCVKNIYDMAGNVWEWTMESYKENYRIYRGGMFEMGNEKPSASMRAHVTPDWYNDRVGFRVALYVI